MDDWRIMITSRVLTAMVFTLALVELALAQSDGDLRLVGGSSPRSGRLEVYYNYRWGTVCDDGFHLNEATVVCRQLGFITNNAGFYPNAFYGQGSGDILLDSIRCGGGESRLEFCTHSSWGSHDCRHSEDVGVSCEDGAAQSATTLRLVEGSATYGRLEILHENMWGTVCDDNFGIEEARVACRQLELDTNIVEYYPSAQFGRGSSVIWLDDLSCDGLENTLANCGHSGFGVGDCTHAEDVGISCGTSQVSTIDSGSSGSPGIISSVGGWTGFAILLGVIFVSAYLCRRRRLHVEQQHQRTTIIQPPTTTLVRVPPIRQGNTPLPTYHDAQPPSSGGAHGTGTPYPRGGYAYPPPSPSGQRDARPSQPYPLQQYTYPPADAAAPAHSVNAPVRSTYPPPQTDDAPPMYLGYGSYSVPPMGTIPPIPEQNLPSPPTYDDAIKQ